MSPAPIRRAAILAIGSELLTASRIDTNSLTITEALNAIGIDVLYKAVIGDDRGELTAQFAHAVDRMDLVVLTGGLGPTEDDLTRDVVAAHLRLPLQEDAAITESIRSRFAMRGWTMPEINRRQAMVPRGAAVLANSNGTAPGLWIDSGDKAIVLLPGPPREMKPMFETVVAERLRPRAVGALLVRRVLRIAGRTESRVEELTQPFYGPWREQRPSIETTILSVPGQIELHLSARGTDERSLNDALDSAVAAVQRVMPHDVFSTDGQVIEEVVGRLLQERGCRIALAESCTGGLATSRLTDVPGSSAYVDRSAVVYSNAAKTEMLGVPESLLVTHGAVSEPVAEAMAAGIRSAAGVEVGVGITGIAGPGGGSDAKPVGIVCIAVVASGAGGDKPLQTARTFRFPGNRALIKTFAAFTALDMVRRLLVGAAADADWDRK